MNTTLPLHPLVVHLPLALAVVLPFLAAGILLAWWRRWLPGRRSWAVVVALQAFLTLSAWVALRTGAAEEERVEAVVGETVLEAHEEAAEVFLGSVTGVLVLSVLTLLIPGEGATRMIAALALVGMGVGTVLAIRVGEAGGELVYRHGAATAYHEPSAPAPRPALEDDD